MRYFARNYRAIAYNARGYPPSDVPEDVSMYGQQRATDDILAVLDALEIDKAHIVGLSMGGFATLHFGFHYPDRALSLTVAGAGYGAHPDVREQFKQESAEVSARILSDTMAEFSKIYAIGPTRVQFANKDPAAGRSLRSPRRPLDPRLGQHHASGPGVAAPRSMTFPKRCRR